jgi:hypothetical protein
MGTWFSRRWWVLMAALLAVVALVIVGGLAARTPHAAEPGFRVAYDAGYRADVQEGIPQGRDEGRALQEGVSVATASRQPVVDAFRSDYAAGANDAFAGYDGGWVLGEAYVVTLTAPPPPISYRIQTRTPIEPGVNYFACPEGRSLCQSHQ